MRNLAFILPCPTPSDCVKGSLEVLPFRDAVDGVPGCLPPKLAPIPVNPYALPWLMDGFIGLILDLVKT